MSAEVGVLGRSLLDGIRHHAGTTIGVGVALLIGGVIALVAPLMAGISVMLVMGVLLIMGGIALIMLAFRVGAFGSGLPLLIMGALLGVTGLLMVARPLEALASLTLLLAAYFIVSGMIEFFAAWGERPAEGWGWMAATGALTVLLGIMLWRQFPMSGAWAVGTLFGIKLLISGWWLLSVGLAVRRALPAPAQR